MPADVGASKTDFHSSGVKASLVVMGLLRSSSAGDRRTTSDQPYDGAPACGTLSRRDVGLGQRRQHLVLEQTQAAPRKLDRHATAQWMQLHERHRLLLELGDELVRREHGVLPGRAQLVDVGDV